ncbi:ribonuclease III domain-containing protein [Multifurca ochricompacta]|uniref:Ribonuclease III domain-containing protein n=1 Tax=Multifurca ochricompacta TaxID=376703 RepID=A0AAD4QSS2_9AGAM|nr:ribonuclease III domain-containing protein [Multifurca ochricompacta]
MAHLKLEHVGDQVLGLIVTDLLQKLFPYLRVGPSTKMRALVVGNSTLATIAVQYKLLERLRLHIAQSVTLKASTHVQVLSPIIILTHPPTCTADVFESYVGGLYKDQGLAAVKVWLDQLFTPYVREAYRIVREQHGLPPSAPTTSFKLLSQLPHLRHHLQSPGMCSQAPPRLATWDCSTSAYSSRIINRVGL